MGRIPPTPVVDGKSVTGLVLKNLPSPDSADFDPRDPAAVSYDWPLSANLLRLVPGTLLLLLLLWRARQGRAAWLILLPIGAVLIVLSILAHSLFDEQYSILQAVILAGTLGLASVWLLPNTSACSRMAAYSRTLAIMLVAGVTIPIFTGFEAMSLTVIPLAGYAIAIVGLVFALRVAAARRRPHRSRGRTLLNQLLWLVVTAALTTPFLLFLAVSLADVFGEMLVFRSGRMAEAVIVVCLEGAILGGLTCALATPFLLLSTFSGFFRQRLHSDFSLPWRDAGLP